MTTLRDTILASTGHHAGVKRVRTNAWAAGVGILLVFTIFFGVFNAFRLGIDIWVLTPTRGSYHPPISTTLTIISGVVGAVVTLMMVGTIVVRWLRRSPLEVPGPAFAAVGLFALAGVTGLWLPFVHTNEVDVTPSGFAQPSYEIVHTGTVTVYDATQLPVTICTGLRTGCSPDPHAPAALNRLSLKAGQAVDVDLTDIADYTLTIATPAPGMSSVDTVMHAVITYCEDHPDAANC
jgi:hypothetical protein